MSRIDRLLSSKKQEKIIVSKGKPSLSDLKEGTPVLRSTSKGLAWYVKYNGELYEGFFKKMNARSLRLYIDDIRACHSDTDKFLVYDRGEIKFRTGVELIDDIGAGSGSGDITGVTLTTDSGDASDTTSNVDITISGGDGVDTSASGTTVTITGEAASTTNAGIVEIATAAETNTGTDATRAVSPDAIEDWTGSAQFTTTGALNSGSITSGFGNIDVGSSTIDTTGNVSVGDLQVNGNDIAFDAAASTIAIDASAEDTVGQALTISAGDTTAGTSNDIAGGSLIFQGGQGKGSGAGGSIVFSVADGGSSGSSLNSLVTALTIDDNKDIICNGGPLHVKAPSGGSADLFLIADDEEDNPDIWRIRATDSAASNVLSFSNKISGSQVTHFTISPHATVTSSNAIFAGNLAVNGTSGITSGAVIWESFPFIASSIVGSRGFYFRDNDDPEDFRKWDVFDADMVLTNDNIYGHYMVPEDCTLTHMRGIVANDGSTDDVTINVWYCLQTNIETDTTSTTFTKAGSDTDVTIGTSEVGVQFNEDYDVDLTAGSIVIPTVKNGGAGGDSFLGSLTLKFITR